MVKVKQMSYEEKYAGVADYVNMLYGFVLPVVERNLGVEKVAALKATLTPT